ncbi:zinc-binding dehydrogenase [Micromonospora sp. NPDC047527]|uniref:zinc-binding dehydrogenase n=1 Tax=unclassified Micromonospora TaxID=2617518 RepID=UPI0033E3C9B1
MSRAFGYRAFGGPEVQLYFDRPDPQPGDGEILVKVRAAGVARLDHLLRSGAVRMLNGHVPFPQVMGMEAAGDVLAVGAGDVPAQVRELAPSGVDGVIDLVGGDSLRAIAGLVKDAKQLLSAADSIVSELGGEYLTRRLGRASLEAVAALMVDGTIDPQITRTFTFDQSAEALAAVETGHTTGKLVIAVTA